MILSEHAESHGSACGGDNHFLAVANHVVRDGQLEKISMLFHKIIAGISHVSGISNPDLIRWK